MPKDAKPGCSMRGSLKLAKTSPLAGDKPAPNSVTLVYTVPPAKKAADEDNGKADVEEPPLTALKNARRDADVRACPLPLLMQLTATCCAIVASKPGAHVCTRRCQCRHAGVDRRGRCS